ncbi:hypothetical protein AVEN_46503-1 [Araneus ventricosus]|uniref:Uncharacterized protein n=1 Tax=Araneus ventricosus TaxID=182803 RepID=A0A4Y2EP51_ARAVE|nr:hypothetical protein AVEN_46503-1 [Araneus ventricosus]
MLEHVEGAWHTETSIRLPNMSHTCSNGLRSGDLRPRHLCGIVSNLQITLCNYTVFQAELAVMISPCVGFQKVKINILRIASHPSRLRSSRSRSEVVISQRKF